MNQPRQEKSEDIVLFGELSADSPCGDHLARIDEDSPLTYYDPQPIHLEVPTIDDGITISEVEIRGRLIEWLVGFLPGGPRADLESVSPQGGTGSTTLVTSIAIAVLLGALALAQPGAYSQDDASNPPRKAVQSRPRGRGVRAMIPATCLEGSRHSKGGPWDLRAAGGPGVPPAVTGSSSYWECTDGETILTVDLRGNASYRKVPGWVPCPPDEGGRPGALRSSPDEAGLVQRTRRLAASWLPAERLGSLKPAVKRETLLLAKLPGGAISEMRGRTIVRFLGQDGGFFQAVFDPESALLRVDLAVADAPTLDLCDLAILARLSAKGKPAIKTPLNLGCFFDPGEYRFEINAFAVEGEPFLDLYQELNPFGATNST